MADRHFATGHFPGSHFPEDHFAVDAASLTSAALSGTSVGVTAEQDWVDGGLTTAITLDGETWVAAGATFDAQRQNLLDAFDSSRSEANGFENEVRTNEAVTSVVRTSDTVVTITWSAAPAYDVALSEIVSLPSIPATALTGGQAIAATGAMQISADSSGNPRALLRGAGRDLVRSIERNLAGAV